MARATIPVMKLPLRAQKEGTPLAHENELREATVWYANMLGQSTVEQTSQMLDLLNVPAKVVKNEPSQDEKSDSLR